MTVAKSRPLAPAPALGRLVAAAFLIAAAARCSGISNPSATYDTVTYNSALYALNGTPVGAATAINTATAATVRADAAYDFDVAFDLDASGVGGFPDLKHPQVVWIVLRCDALKDLAARIDEAASRCGFEREQRAFNGHLTIVRVRRPRLHSETRRRLEAMAGRRCGISSIREMTLYRSITAATGPVYEPLAKFQFKSAT